MTQKHYRHKLILDEGVESRRFFPQLNNLFNVRHITQDYKFTGLSDSDVHAIAVKEKRIIITYNIKDFKPLAIKSKQSGVVGITMNTSPELIDKKLVALFRRAAPKELYGKFTSLNF